MRKRIDRGQLLNLNDQLNAIEKGLIQAPMIGTPTASMKKRSGRFMSKSLNPNEYVSLFPTPRTNNGTGTSCHGNGGMDLQTFVNGKLNPDWVEALMGYPLHWTNICNSMLICGNFPDDWTSGEWERWIPRTTTDRKNRVKRLKCLGNAIVPQCAKYIFGLEAFDEWRKNE
jgi:hypothetical protein